MRKCIFILGLESSSLNYMTLHSIFTDLPVKLLGGVDTTLHQFDGGIDESWKSQGSTSQRFKFKTDAGKKAQVELAFSPWLNFFHYVTCGTDPLGFAFISRLLSLFKLL